MTAPTVERVRHELRFRIAEVVRAERLTPRMARITLTGPDFDRFVSLAYDDHVKLFFAAPGLQNGDGPTTDGTGTGTGPRQSAGSRSRRGET